MIIFSLSLIQSVGWDHIIVLNRSFLRPVLIEIWL